MVMECMKYNIGYILAYKLPLGCFVICTTVANLSRNANIKHSICKYAASMHKRLFYNFPILSILNHIICHCFCSYLGYFMVPINTKKGSFTT
jgi:hypothetical protein